MSSAAARNDAVRAIDYKESYTRVVVKVGTSTLVDETGRIDPNSITRIIEQIAQLHARGIQVVLVSSGAITAGLESLGMATGRPDDMPTLQAAASVGQVELAKHYDKEATKHGIHIGQVLLTRGDTSRRSAYLHARNTLERLLELGVLPLVNENDTTSIEEIRFGDNDTLAATVATLIGADLVILLSDIEGLYTADPRIHEDAELLTCVGKFTERIVKSAGGVGSKTGSGGMATKVEAARVLMRANIPMIICEGHIANAIIDVVDGKQIGTLFSNEEAASRMQPRKLWIALGDKAHGKVTIDEGACTALRDHGRSLLPVGVKQVTGTFAAGAVVNIRDSHGRLVGRGISRYSSREIKECMGRRSDEISGLPECAHLAGVDVIHRDEMVIF